MNTELTERKRRQIIISSAVFNIGSKGCQFALMLIAFSVTLPYLGAEKFGVFSTVLGFGSILAILDLGIGNVLIGSIARLNAKEDRVALGVEIKCGLVILSAIGFFFFLILMTLTWIIPVEYLFRGVSIENQRETKLALITFFAAFCFSLPVQGLQRISQGLQKSYLSHIFSIAFTCSSAVLLFFAVKAQAGIPVLLLVSYVIPALAPMCMLFFIWPAAAKGKLTKEAIIQAGRRFFSQGGIFLLLQLGALAGWGIDAVLAANRLGVASAGIFAITQKLFQMLTYPLAIVNLPLWAAYADAHARDDRGFIRNCLKKSLIRTVLTAVCGAAFMLFFSESIIELWFHKKLDIPFSLLLFCAIWAVIEASGNAYAMFMNGLNMMRVQIFPNIAFFVSALMLKVYLITTIGLAGLPLGTMIAYIVSIAIPYILFIRPHRAWTLSNI